MEIFSYYWNKMTSSSDIYDSITCEIRSQIFNRSKFSIHDHNTHFLRHSTKNVHYYFENCNFLLRSCLNGVIYIDVFILLILRLDRKGSKHLTPIPLAYNTKFPSHKYVVYFCQWHRHSVKKKIHIFFYETVAFYYCCDEMIFNIISVLRYWLLGNRVRVGSP